MDSENRTETQKILRMLSFVYAPIAVLLVVTLYFFMRIDVSLEELEMREDGTISSPTQNAQENTSLRTKEQAVLPATSTTKIAVLGDSITAGYGLDLRDAYPSVLERILKEAGYDVSVLNSGVSGDTTAGGLSRAEFVVSQRPDIVIIALGGNDMLRGIDPAATRNNLAGTIEIFQRADVEVVLAGMYAAQNLGEAYVSQFNAIYPALASEFRIPLIPFLLDGVALDPSKNQADKIHPNKEGARVIAEQNVFPNLLPLLSERVF